MIRNKVDLCVLKAESLCTKQTATAGISEL